MEWHSEYIHHAAVDVSNKYGAVWGFLRRGETGGSFDYSAYCGSRSFISDSSTARILQLVSARCCSEML